MTKGSVHFTVLCKAKNKAMYILESPKRSRGLFPSISNVFPPYISQPQKTTIVNIVTNLHKAQVYSYKTCVDFFKINMSMYLFLI